MWNDQKSLALTRWCVRLFALALAAADLGGYWLVRWYMSWNTETIGQGLREGLLMMASLYLCSLPAWAALYWLHRLLGSIAKGQVFVPENVRALRAMQFDCAAIAAATRRRFSEEENYRTLMKLYGRRAAEESL